MLFHLVRQKLVQLLTSHIRIFCFFTIHSTYNNCFVSYPLQRLDFQILTKLHYDSELQQPALFVLLVFYIIINFTQMV